MIKETPKPLPRKLPQPIFRRLTKRSLYLWQYDFLWNTRKMNDGERTVLAIREAEGKPLMYREPRA